MAADIFIHKSYMDIAPATRDLSIQAFSNPVRKNNNRYCFCSCNYLDIFIFCLFKKICGFQPVPVMHQDCDTRPIPAF